MAFFAYADVFGETKKTFEEVKEVEKMAKRIVIEREVPTRTLKLISFTGDFPLLEELWIGDVAYHANSDLNVQINGNFPNLKILNVQAPVLPQNCPNLEELYVSTSGEEQEIDLSCYPKLKKLRVNGNLTVKNVPLGVVDLSVNDHDHVALNMTPFINCPLKRLSFYGVNLGKLDFLSSFVSLEELEINFCPADVEDSTSLLKLPNLRNLYLRKFHIDLGKIKEIKTLKELHIYRHDVDEIDFVPDSVETLTIIKNCDHCEGCLNLEYLRHHPNLKNFDSDCRDVNQEEIFATWPNRQ